MIVFINGLIDDETHLGNHLLCEMEADQLKNDNATVWRGNEGYAIASEEENEGPEGFEFLGTLGELFADIDEAEQQ